MRLSHEKPTGVWVCGPDGDMVRLTFPGFIAAIEEGALHPDDRVWSHIVTDGRWVRARDMRLYQRLAGRRQNSGLSSHPTINGDRPPSSPLF